MALHKPAVTDTSTMLHELRARTTFFGQLPPVTTMDDGVGEAPPMVGWKPMGACVWLVTVNVSTVEFNSVSDGLQLRVVVVVTVRDNGQWSAMTVQVTLSNPIKVQSCLNMFDSFQSQGKTETEQDGL